MIITDIEDDIEAEIQSSIVLARISRSDDDKRWVDSKRFLSLLSCDAKPVSRNIQQSSGYYLQEADYKGYRFVTVTEEKIDYFWLPSVNSV